MPMVEGKKERGHKAQVGVVNSTAEATYDSMSLQFVAFQYCFLQQDTECIEVGSGTPCITEGAAKRRSSHQVAARRREGWSAWRSAGRKIKETERRRLCVGIVVEAWEEKC